MPVQSTSGGSRPEAPIRQLRSVFPKSGDSEVSQSEEVMFLLIGQSHGAIDALCGIVGGWAVALAAFLVGLVVPNVFVSVTHRPVAD